MRTAAFGITVVLVCAGFVTGCQDQGSTTRAAASSSASPTQVPATVSPTSPTSPTSPGSPTSRTSPASPSTSRGDRLLTAADLPGLDAGYRWQQAGTSTREPPSLFGTCQRFEVTSIGAQHVVVRHYLPASAAPRKAGDRAGELVATFPDAMTARRAFAVLEAWRKQCADRLSGHRRSQVGDLQDVALAGAGGTGEWYLLSYGPVRGHSGTRYLDAQGMAVVGSRIAMVSMLEVGGDPHDQRYAPGREPMVAAVRRAAARLG